MEITSFYWDFFGRGCSLFCVFYSFFTCVFQCKNKFDCDKCDIPLIYNIPLNKQNTLITVSKVNPIHNHTSVIGTMFFICLRCMNMYVRWEVIALRVYNHLKLILSIWINISNDRSLPWKYITTLLKVSDPYWPLI